MPAADVIQQANQPSAFMALRNRRFVFDPYDNKMHLGTGDIANSTHAEEYAAATSHLENRPLKRERQFDNCARGWVSGKFRGYPYGIIHFAPPVTSAGGYHADRYLDTALKAIKHFIGQGAQGKTIVRGFTALGGPWEQPLGNALPELFPKRRKARAVVEAILTEVYSQDLGYLNRYLKGPHEHGAHETWWKFASWAEDDEDVMTELSQILGHQVTTAEELQEEDPEIYNQLSDETKRAYQGHLEGRTPSEIYGTDADAPTWMHMSHNRVIERNTWLVHFSDHARDIWQEGFKRGVEDVSRLGLTNYLGDREKDDGGWCFAFQAESRDAAFAASKGKYGKHAVIFQSAGVEATHYGDEENQVIFYGPHVKPGSIILVEKDRNSDMWGVVARRGGGNHEYIFQAERFEQVVKWITANYAQYRRSLVAESMAEAIIGP